MFDYRALYEIQLSVSVDLLRVVQLHPEELAYFQHYLDNPRNLLKICRDVLRSHYKGRGIYKYIHTNGEYSSQSGSLYLSQVISMSLKISLYILGCYLEKCCNTLSSKRFIPFKKYLLSGHDTCFISTRRHKRFVSTSGWASLQGRP